jgi:protein SCO1/2
MLLVLPVSGALAQQPQNYVGNAGARGATAQDKITKDVGLTQKLNGQVPLDLTFRDETGRTVHLNEYFRGKPVLLNLIQYRCTMLCSQEMEVFADSLRQLKFDVGDQFVVVTVSIDDREQPALAADYKKKWIEEYARPGAAAAWHFLVGDKTNIQRLADSLGYRFAYDPATDQFAHPDGVQVLTPEGRISRYFFGLTYPPRDLRFAIIDSSKNRIGSAIDAFALLCFHYNPITGRYSLELMRVLRVAAVGTVLTGLLAIGAMSWRLKRLEQRAAEAGQGAGGEGPVAEIA